MLFSTCSISPKPALPTFSLSVCLYHSRFCPQVFSIRRIPHSLAAASDAVVALILSDKLNNVWNSLHKDCYTDEETTERGLLSSFMAGDVLWPFNWAGLLWYGGGLFISRANFISCKVPSSREQKQQSVYSKEHKRITTELTTVPNMVTKII